MNKSVKSPGRVVTMSYVFWRKPDGKPYRLDDGKYAPTALLARIGEAARVDQKRGVSWQGWWVYEYDLAIRSAVVVLDPNGDELNERDTWSLVDGAIRTIIKKQDGGTPVNHRDVIKEANARASAHFRKPITDYTLVSSLSVDSFPARRIRVHDRFVSPLRERGKRFPYPEVLCRQARGTAIEGHLECTAYRPVKVKTAGRSVHEAVDNAIRALSLLRGLWTLFATYGSVTRRYGSPKQIPLGVIHAGPVHTLHQSDGTLVEEYYWYDPDYAGDQELYKPKDGWDKIEKHRRWASRRLRQLPYRRDLEDLIIRYATGLDHLNLDVAFLQLWGILEKVTDTVGGKYDETIKQAIWVYEDRQEAKQLLQSLRFRRNQFVHAAKSSEERDQIVFMIKSFVEPHLLRLIRNDFRVRSLQEYGKFLSLPTNVDSLETRWRQLGQALRTRKRWAAETQSQNTK